MKPKKMTPQHVIEKKQANEKLVMLTAYDYITASLLEEIGVDMILVGDSLGNVFAGHDSTIPVTVDQIIYHTQIVTRAAKNSLVIADMPFLSYHVSAEDTKLNAGRLIKEGGAQAVKVEVGQQSLDYIKELVDIGIPVLAHIGFTPQMIHSLGGFKVQGRSKEQQEYLLSRAKELEAIGCFGVLLEMLPSDLSKSITESLSVPTIGIGAGPDCDGQVLVTEDVVGLSGFEPKFVKKYASLRDDMKSAISDFKSDVASKSFPKVKQTFQ